MGAVSPTTAIERARAERARAETLARDAAANRRRTEELCEVFASFWVEAGRSFGDRGERFRLRLARLLPLLRFARSDLRRWLESRGVAPDVVNDTTLAFSEACANAIEHASRPTRQLVEIEARCDAAQLLVRIRDYGSWAEQTRSESRGRGLGMIEQLMDAVAIERSDEGTEIVMRRRLGSPA